MRTDRELLELAAKAAGIRDQLLLDADVLYWLDQHYENGDMVPWVPLDDDGDTLRLAAKLELDIMYRVVGGNRVEVLPPGGPLTVVRYIDDRLAATRRAIVDAAAEVGAKLAKRARAQVAEPAHNEIGDRNG